MERRKCNGASVAARLREENAVTTTTARETVGPSARRPDGLDVRLDAPVPRELEVGAGTALFVCGTCFHREQRVRGLRFVLDGREQPVEAHGMPRIDEFQALHPEIDVFAIDGMEVDRGSPEDPNLRGYLTGFWGTVKIGPRPEGPFELLLRAELENSPCGSRRGWCRPVGGHLHGHLQSPHRPVSSPGRIDQIADPLELDLCGER